MVSLLDYYIYIMVLWEGVELGTGVGKGTNSKQIDVHKKLEAGIQIESMGASTGSGKGVLAHTFLEEIRLALEGDQLHPRESKGDEFH